ncbi:MAG TPA: TolC family protein [Longimicrobiales bacterium]|nr:TolC family protein [Longimicrobiales bacterium]
MTSMKQWVRKTASSARRTGIVAMAAAAGMATAAPAASQPAPGRHEGFTLEEAYGLAATRSPVLQAAAASADAAAAMERSAGLPPDPMIQLGIMNFSIPGFGLDMPTSMAPSIQAMQMLPIGRLGPASRIARQQTRIARAGAAETWWEVRSRTAMAFYMIYEADRQLDVMAETRQLLETFEQAARTMYAAGDGRQSDVLRAGVEVSRMDADIRRMEAMRGAAVARLNGMLDRPSNTPVPPVVLGTLAMDLPPLDTLRAWAEDGRPMLAGGRGGVEQAEARTTLARREIWPEPIIGVQYGQRSGEMGTERMASAMVGFSIPVFAGSRQLRMRDEAAAMEAMARADLGAMRAEVDARLGELTAELDRTRTLIALYRAEILPQARANVEASFSSYRVGRVDFMTLIDAQMMASRFEQEMYGFLAEYGRAIAELEMTVGREMPRVGELLAEAP